MESLILAQDERWRHASHMQVERDLIKSLLLIKSSGGRVSNTWATCPIAWDTIGKLMLIPDTLDLSHDRLRKDLSL
jgi:hypothetical protein